MPYTSAYEQYLQALAERDTTTQGYMPGLITPPVPEERRGSLYDFLGNLTWGA